VTTETGWLVGMIEDLLPVAGNTTINGDDGEEHGLEVQIGADGEYRRWLCACTHWDTMNDGQANLDVARSFLHHVYPSRYAARPSTIMAETLRSLRQSTTTNPTR
jgi:hypothetical protein